MIRAIPGKMEARYYHPITTKAQFRLRNSSKVCGFLYSEGKSRGTRRSKRQQRVINSSTHSAWSPEEDPGPTPFNIDPCVPVYACVGIRKPSAQAEQNIRTSISLLSGSYTACNVDEGRRHSISIHSRPRRAKQSSYPLRSGICEIR